ncbi:MULTISPECIES: hypothetical protein [Enterobacter cloacae complex]|uniref:hypothetical protein n=1 Tax=Enterobacter cloacae complex TaxID=354276 RepID=UPI00066838A7|nr:MULTISPECIES: hypothetical protein [Enterobacter cloacae complex]MDU6333987.1 hypothetical protein [Enterobacter hormaechei]MED5728774.1 hypothetical protein [Enterobacter hormaechei]
MSQSPYDDEFRAIRYIQLRGQDIANAHETINSDIESLKAQLTGLISGTELDEAEHLALKEHHLREMTPSDTAMHSTGLKTIYSEANQRVCGDIGLATILSTDDLAVVDARIQNHIKEFNDRYALDAWDYAIACGCGLIASMLDLLCVRAPPKPTVSFTAEVDGIFNKQVQKAFNAILPEDLSTKLSDLFPIGAPDSSISSDLVGAAGGVLSPTNHRLRALSHDPVLGIIFGIKDMLNGTCTVVQNGQIVVYPSSKGVTDETNIFRLIARMFGHLASGVNAPSAKGNRGMGLPAPFMGLLRMLEGIPVGSSNFGKQIEYMYVNGYDFRQFIVTSIPMSIMEVLMRVFYVAKQVSLGKGAFGETLLDTMPLRLNPRFRMMLALGYGTSSAVNAGKMYITGNILNANYASWMGLAWNGFHSLKWSLYQRHLKLWAGIEKAELERLQNNIDSIEALTIRAGNLPVK